MAPCQLGRGATGFIRRWESLIIMILTCWSTPHTMTLVYDAYQTICQVVETCIACLGDLARYRMAIEEHGTRPAKHCSHVLCRVKLRRILAVEGS